MNYPYIIAIIATILLVYVLYNKNKQTSGTQPIIPPHVQPMPTPVIPPHVQPVIPPHVQPTPPTPIPTSPIMGPARNGSWIFNPGVYPNMAVQVKYGPQKVTDPSKLEPVAVRKDKCIRYPGCTYIDDTGRYYTSMRSYALDSKWAAHNRANPTQQLGSYHFREH